MKLKTLGFGLLMALTLLLPASFAAAEDTPQQVFQRYVDAVTEKNLEKMLTTISAEKRKDGPKTEAEKKSAMEFLYHQRPTQIKILEEKTDKNGKTASMKVEAMVAPFLTFDPKKTKPEKEKGLILFVKENGEWKIDEQKWGDLAEEEKGEKASFGKKISLKSGASVTFQKGSAGAFSSVKTSGKASAVDVVFQRGEGESSPMLNYVVHPSPTFADFYWKAEDKKVPPVAMIDDPDTRAVKALEANTTYSRSRNIPEKKYVLSLLFDLPKVAKTPLTFLAKFSVDDQKYVFEVGP